MDWFRQENITLVTKQAFDVVKSFTDKPLYAIGLMVLLLFGSHFMANIMATPFGLGLLLGIGITIYYVVNYTKSTTTTTRSTTTAS